MKTTKLYFAIAAAAVLTAPAFAVDGTTLINQSIVMAAGGFPYNITQSGSYTLSGNLVLTAGNAQALAINITAANVTLNLNGFSITCNSCTSAPSAFGILINSGNVVIQNGAIANFIASTSNSSGILFQGGSGGRVDRMVITNDGNTGVGVGITGGVSISNTTITESNAGIFVDVTGAVIQVSNCVIMNNNSGIITVGGAFSILNNLITGGTFGMSLSGTGAYGLNTIVGTTVPVTGGTSLGNNVCSASGPAVPC